jgi:hypothetical protein
MEDPKVILIWLLNVKPQTCGSKHIKDKWDGFEV